MQGSYWDSLLQSLVLDDKRDAAIAQIKSMSLAKQQEVVDNARVGFKTEHDEVTIFGSVVAYQHIAPELRLVSDRQLLEKAAVVWFEDESISEQIDAALALVP